ncbi:MAG: ABC transporter ATP-binding protein [Candidatus Velthaea sp.]|jgi:branched-chain amino acid transport system ATP-binding protein
MILQTHGLSRTFAGFTAVRDVALAVREGSIHGIIGPNGAGKTTLFNLLSGFLAPTSGTIAFRGRDITRLNAAAVARAGIVRSFQITSIFAHLSVLDNVRVSLESKTELPFRFWLPGSRVDGLTERAAAILAQVGLTAQAPLLAAQLSYGHKRALELGISIAQNPAVLLLDEPTAGMGREDIGRVTALIRAVAAERTVVLVEHNLSVVSELCDRITVMQRGSILVEGSYADVRADQRVIDAYLGGQHA